MLGIELTDFDVGKRSAAQDRSLRQLHSRTRTASRRSSPASAVDGIPNTADDIVVSGTPAAPVNPTTVCASAPAMRSSPTSPMRRCRSARSPMATSTIGLANPGNGDAEYDNELLDAHFIAGDGRVNENIGLTAVHHVFHAEHNRLVDHTKEVVLATRRSAPSSTNGS